MSFPRLRTIFLGTPEAAVPSLEQLTSVSEVVAVITRPDRPRGRSGQPQSSAVKLAAARMGLSVLQPSGSAELTAVLADLAPLDVAVVTAFGSLLRPEALAIPRRGFLNLHFSLLPRWRGASPVTAAIAAGDVETGVTIMSLDSGLDTGPIVAARAVVIGLVENGGELTARLAALGAELLGEVMAPWARDEIEAFAQPEASATLAPRLRPGDLRLDLDLPASKLALRVRALAPRPGATLEIDGQRVRVLAADPAVVRLPRGHLGLVDDRVMVGTSAAALELLTIHPPGRNPMSARDWWRGTRRTPDTAR
ncbi:MAG TPA: methionyl-tRNA formyltransferase [Acidimicrobiia bacterium]|nr:methionyl-tRNA formyltransferase [Acidimicrobiia bacterium]